MENYSSFSFSGAPDKSPRPLEIWFYSHDFCDVMSLWLGDSGYIHDFLFNPFILANHRPWNIEEIFLGGKDRYIFIFWSTHKYMPVFSQSLFIHPHWKITLFLHCLELRINPRSLWKSGSILMIFVILWMYGWGAFAYMHDFLFNPFILANKDDGILRKFS